MALTIVDPELEKRVLASVERGEFSSPDQLVRSALDLLLGEEDVELEEIRSAVAEGLEQANRGEGIPLDEFDRRMRQKHGIPG